MYVAANGSSSNSGKSSSSATTLQQAIWTAMPGDVVCIAPGTYDVSSELDPTHSGTASSWITYTGYGSGAVNIVWTGPVSKNMFHMYGSSFPNGPSYIAFEGLTLDGRNNAQYGFFCQNAHHNRFSRNTIMNMGQSGIGSADCDYLTSDHNLIYHNGYNEGWSSGISYYSTQWYDSYTGLHNIIADNIIAGEFDNSSNHTDGNGIIFDTSTGSYTASTANTPPGLIVNNVVYGNGGRCIENFIVTNIWVVNNTCYDNMLDLTLGKQGEIVNNSANSSYYVNNLVESWDQEYPFSVQGSSDTNLTFSHNMIYGGGNSNTPGTGFTTANPEFNNPMAYNATAGGQYTNTINPSSLGNALDIQSNSPAIGAGIDPTTLAGGNTNLKSDMSKWVYTDINGSSRTIGGLFTLGAYEH